MSAARRAFLRYREMGLEQTQGIVEAMRSGNAARRRDVWPTWLGRRRASAEQRTRSSRTASSPLKTPGPEDLEPQVVTGRPTA